MIPLRLNRRSAGLILIDLQERLVPAMCNAEPMVANCVRLARGAALLAVPIWVTEQYRKGLGPTVAAVAEATPGVVPVEKLTFSAWAAEGLSESVAARGVQELVVCGIESHVCVLQTCLQILESGRRVWVVADATTSRGPDNHRLALERLRSAGAGVVTTEMVLFELLERAGTEEFKKVQALVK